MRAVPESMVPAGAFTKVEDVLDRPVISPIQPDEPVVEARHRGQGQRHGAGAADPDRAARDLRAGERRGRGGRVRSARDAGGRAGDRHVRPDARIP